MTGFFSIYGLVNTYKDKEGKLTKHGRIAVYGIVLSLTLSIVGFGIKLKKDSNDKSSKLKQIQQDISRQLITINKLDTILRLSFPISDIQIISTFSISDTTKEIREFDNEFKKIVNVIRNERNRFGVALDIPENVYDNWEGDVLKSVSIDNNSPIFPNSINLPMSVISFFDRTLNADNLNLQSSESAFEAIFTAPVYNKKSKNLLSKRLVYLPERGQYQLITTYIPIMHSSNGNIISHKDIKNVKIGLSILLDDDIKIWKIGSIVFKNNLGYQTIINGDSLKFSGQSWPKLTYTN